MVALRSYAGYTLLALFGAAREFIRIQASLNGTGFPQANRSVLELHPR
jgi:hypothetical protein